MSNEQATSTANLPTLFADGMLEAHVRNGVARVTLGQAGADGKATATAQLVMPLAQMPGFVSGLARLLQEFAARAKQVAQAQPQPQPIDPPEGGFRFGTT